MFAKPNFPSCSVIIPAYNEENCIGTTLNSLTNDMKPGEFEIIIVCNGCVDGTAAIARNAYESARVLETDMASKTDALNIGIRAAKSKTIVFLDADIKTSAAAVHLLTRSLRSTGLQLGFGRAVFNTKNCSASVRAFYKAWHLNPYFDGGKVGGFFAVSHSGCQHISPFPQLTNDDEYVRRALMAKSAFVPAAKYTVEPPHTLLSLIKVRSRIYRGNRELKCLSVSKPRNQGKASGHRFLLRLLKSPSNWAGAMVFLAVALAAHMRNGLLRQDSHWEQDLTTRALKG